MRRAEYDITDKVRATDPVKPSRLTAHSAFDDPARESIETRTFAFFE